MNQDALKIVLNNDFMREINNNFFLTLYQPSSHHLSGVSFSIEFGRGRIFCVITITKNEILPKSLLWPITTHQIMQKANKGNYYRSNRYWFKPRGNVRVQYKPNHRDVDSLVTWILGKDSRKYSSPEFNLDPVGSGGPIYDAREVFGGPQVSYSLFNA